MKRYIFSLCFALLSVFLATPSASDALFLPVPGNADSHLSKSAKNPDNTEKTAERKQLKKVLFIGDSMTGWMAERMEAYGIENGFEVATVLWDGSTISKWANSGKIASLVEKYKPDLVCISLGMNELLEKNPETRLSSSVGKILAGIGSTPYLWVGPPSWPGKGKGETLNKWLAEKLAPDCYFTSNSLSLDRQSKSNPHPTKEAIKKWIDGVVSFLNHSPAYNFKPLAMPAGVQMKRGKVFIYKKMKETL